jgi:hypothetical protein
VTIHLVEHKVTHVDGPAGEAVDSLTLLQSTAPLAAIYIPAGEPILSLTVILA